MTAPAVPQNGDPFAPETRDNPTGYRVREFTVTAERIGEGDDAPLRIALSSEAPVERWSWDPELRETGGYYDEVLDHGVGSIDLSYVKDGLPFCLDHNIRAQIGIGTMPELGSDRVLRTEVSRGNHPDAAWVFADMAAGVRKKVSIGYWPGTDYTQTKDAKTGRITRTHRGWMLFEGSSVAVPADYAVGVGRSAIRARPESPAVEAAHTTETQMPVETSERGAPPTPDTRLAELRVLRANFKNNAPVSAFIDSRYADWVDNADLSIDTVRDQIIGEMSRTAEQRAPINPTTPNVEIGRDRAEDKPYESMTEFMREVKLAASGRAPVRLAARAATGMGIGTDSDGGFMVPEQFATGVVTRAFAGGKLLSRVRRIPITGNQYHMTLIDETSRVAGSQWGGVRAYRIGEGTAPTVTKPKTRRATLDVTKKIGVAVWASEEQLEDASATDAIITDAMSEALTFQLESEIWSGNGGAECLGFTKSGSYLSVSKKSGQTSGTFIAENAVAMNAALWSGSHGSAVWLVHQFMLAQLPMMTIGTQPIYVGPSGLEGAPKFGTLLGKPVEVVEYASAVGTLGDAVLFDGSQYALGEKGAKGLARSIHVKFLEGEEVYRQVLRADGIPLWNAQLTLADGTSKVSPFVGVETR